jgi:hypothetical protein
VQDVAACGFTPLTGVYGLWWASMQRFDAVDPARRNVDFWLMLQ